MPPSTALEPPDSPLPGPAGHDRHAGAAPPSAPRPAPARRPRRAPPRPAYRRRRVARPVVAVVLDGRGVRHDDTGGQGLHELREGIHAPIVARAAAPARALGSAGMRAARRARILGDADLRQGRCLEIGPLANPVVGAEAADVRYVDVVDRTGLVAHYAGNPAVDPDAIPEQHFWLTRPDGTVSTLAEAVAADAPYQHVVASHVIEHVPDMVGWLRDVAQVLTWDGALLLAVPDRRYCFDVHRAPATVGQVVQAHLDDDRTPSVRAVLDHFMRAVDYSAEQAWGGEQPPTQGSHPIDDVRRHVARQQAGDYVDCHVWPLTPQVFAGLMDDLLVLGQVDFAVERITATRVGDQEFYATLRRLDRRRDPVVATEEARAALARLRAELPGRGAVTAVRRRGPGPGPRRRRPRAPAGADARASHEGPVGPRPGTPPARPGACRGDGTRPAGRHRPGGSAGTPAAPLTSVRSRRTTVRRPRPRPRARRRGRCSASWRHTSARVSPDPTKANQNGAASPQCSAITPPIPCADDHPAEHDRSCRRCRPGPGTPSARPAAARSARRCPRRTRRRRRRT